ncbi:Amino acid permease 6 [Acorus gramineus]|uniref:Amino acid permease 6 n=1 Tax=Acorus gramineus TaxID=55184 RepID=A0AAV9BK31_ACOGR|nr:Amino acid permease 6 [Acorus gramineus]
MDKRAVVGAEEDDHEREGTVWTAMAHVVTAVIGSGVLALAWSVAQMGWIVGPAMLVGFAWVTYYTSTLLADCYRSPNGARNYTYMDAVRSYLGPKKVAICGIIQYAALWGTMVGYTITTATSMMAVKRSNCFHRHGHSAKCGASGNLFMIVFGLTQIILSQLPSLENVTWLSVVAATMSFAYSFIGLCLCTAKWVTHGDIRGTLTGVQNRGGGGSHGFSPAAKTWGVLQALGNMAFAYTFADILIEIQDTLKSPPAENKSMKKATKYGVCLTAAFYLSLACIGYAAFGNDSPGNILTGFGFYEPYWLVDAANVCIVVHLVGAYQVYAQPILTLNERYVASRWPDARFIRAEFAVRAPPFASETQKPLFRLSLSNLVLRTALVALTTLVAMLIPFFNAVLGLIGAFAFWPLSVYFPVSMHVARAKIGRGSARWVALQGLSAVCLMVSVGAGVGSVADIVSNMRHAAPFKNVAY